MQDRQVNDPRILNVDKDRKSLTAEECFYLLNHERPKDSDRQGHKGKKRPMVANYAACELDTPAGENYSTGDYYSPLTNETYSWVYNQNGIHFVQRINGNGVCEIVYYGCLKLSADPKHSIEKFRAYLKIDKLCANVHGKQLIWTNGLHDIGQLDVEASIATNNFTTPFFDRCADPCDLIRMCVPDPCGCVVAEWVSLEEDQAGLTNFLLDVGVSLAYRHVYYDGRAGIWSDPSRPMYQNTKGCFDNTKGFPRCLKARLPIGNPLVEKIEVAYRKDGIWYLADTIEKYKKYNSTQQMWYERELAELENYSDEDCSFDYIFCNDKRCDVIDPAEMNRVTNEVPREAQGLIPVKNSLGFFNYKAGNCPIDKSEAQKFSVKVVCPEDNCVSEMATVTVRALIHNREHNLNQFIYRMNGGADNAADDTSDPAFFGGMNASAALETGYGQRFSGKTRNFIVYAEGENYYGQMTQWKAHAFFNNREQWGTLANLTDSGTKNRWKRAINNGEFFYQEYKMKVRKGTRGFLRLTSHESTTSDQDKSTFVVGTLDITQYKGNLDIDSILNDNVEEIYFDTCAGDVDLVEAFVIEDNAVDDGLSNKASSFYGYVKDLNGLPIEGARVDGGGGVSSVTDHNGFYHFYRFPGTNDPVNISVHVEVDCFSWGNVKEQDVSGAVGVSTRYDFTIDDEDYNDGFYANVKARVIDCNGNAVSGIRVAISGSKYKVTDASGVARFKIRNYETRNRSVRTIVLNNNGCFEVDCSGACNPCMATRTSATTSCYSTKPTITMSEATINVSSVELVNGLKSGGRYPIGFYIRSRCKGPSAVQEIGYLDIPKTQAKGYEGFCAFEFNGNGIQLPEDAECLNIVRGENVNPFMLQWVVDKVERTADGKIRLTIQSLYDYNERYLFKTNTKYNWLQNDRVEFIKNGDGKIFSITEYGLLNYLTVSPFNNELESGEEENETDFFNQLLIEDDGRLGDLTEGAVIEILRPKVCEEESIPYYGVCASIPVVNGQLLYPSGVFHMFDTFRVSRQIGTAPPQIMEHHSPSDFWGERLSDAGRAYFVNKYENERRYGRNITINTENQFNWFGDFVKTFDSPEHGDIIAMFINDGKIGLCISENDNSLFQVADDLLRVDSTGVVRALSSDQIISNPEAKLVGKYGCQYSHIGGICEGDGFVSWGDVNRHTFVVHDYQQAVAADLGKANKFFSTRFQELETHNRSQSDYLNHFRCISGYNQLLNRIMFTIKKLRDPGINNSKKIFNQPNETILFDPTSGDFTTFASFTPERYSRLNLFDGSGCQFVSYLNAIPYIHPITSNNYNEFYGVTCDWVIGYTINKYSEKEKVPVSHEIQDQSLWYTHEVTTDKPNFISEIPPVRYGQSMNKCSASFLANRNSRGGIYGDEGPCGTQISVVIVRDNTDQLKYGTLDHNKRRKYSEIDQIFSKFTMSEQSGFTNNL